MPAAHHAPPTHDCAAPHAARRLGFTIIEVLVAVVLLGVGVLALAGMSRFTALEARDASSRASAADAVESTLDSLRARPCDAVADGSISRGDATLQWRARRGGGAAHLRLELTLRGRGGERIVPFEAVVPCDGR